MTTEAKTELLLRVATGIDGDMDDRLNNSFVSADGLVTRLFVGPITIDEARTISRVLREAAEGGWRPIETAPKDGTEIMLSGITPGTSNRWQGVGAWWHDDWRDDEEDNVFGFHTPSHWRPLPPPPSTEAATHSQEPRNED